MERGHAFQAWKRLVVLTTAAGFRWTDPTSCAPQLGLSHHHAITCVLRSQAGNFQAIFLKHHRCQSWNATRQLCPIVTPNCEPRRFKETCSHIVLVAMHHDFISSANLKTWAIKYHVTCQAESGGKFSSKVIWILVCEKKISPSYCMHVTIEMMASSTLFMRVTYLVRAWRKI